MGLRLSNELVKLDVHALRNISDFSVPTPSKVEVEISARDYTPQYLTLLSRI